MDRERARYLASPSGREALSSLPDEIKALRPTSLARRLRASFPAPEAAAPRVRAKAGRDPTPGVPR